MRPSPKRGAKIPNALLVACLLGVPSDSKASVPECSPEACQSAAASLDYLRRVMDQFHDRFPVYDDLGSAGNHFHARAKIPDEHAPVLILGGSTDQPHSGATATRNELIASSPSAFGGFFFLNGVLPAGHRAPLLNFGTYPNAGIDLTGASALTFWARGAKGGEQVDFFVGGVGWDPDTGLKEARYPDSNPSIHLRVRLTAQWLPYQIDLSGADLSYVLGGFGWAASVRENPKGAVFFLDDIQFELSPAAREARLAQPRLLRSFETLPFQSLPAPVGDFDFVLRNAAHTYDNALALLAFLAQGTPEDLRRARLIGDAFVYASRHDRTHVDGRLRDVYAAGDIALPPGWTPNGKSGTVPIPGFLDEAKQEYFEIDQGQLSAGNNAWVMLALLALYLRTGGEEYLDVARGIGEFLLPLQSQEGLYPGFLGGYKDPEGPQPMRQPWSSTEHNMDIHAAFSILYGIEGRPAWRAGADHARRFVEDGRPVNGNVWVFYGALSDVEYLLRVSDTATGAVRMYRNEPGNLCGRGDTTAFPEYYPNPSAAAYVLRPVGPSAALACSPGSNALCLLGGRFRVSVHWKNQHGGGVEGEGTAIPGTDQTGYFWFFDPTNLELVVKVLDGRPVNGKFWVFYGALSDVEYTLTVTDVETGAERVYVNTPGNLCGKGDTGAFITR